MMFDKDKKKRANKVYNQKYTEDVQRLYLNMLLSDPEAFAIARNILSKDYFDDGLQPAVEYVIEYAEEHKKLPATEQIKAFTGVQLEKFSEGELHTESLLKEVEGFCQYKAMELAVLDGVDLLQSGRAAEIVERTKQAMTISLMSDLGTEYFGDPEARLKRMQDRSAYISTGWTEMDRKLFGGFTKGGLNIFAGSSGCVVAGTKIRVRLDDGLVSKPYTAVIEDLSDANSGVKYLCDSPDGWVPIEQWRNKGIKQTYKLVVYGCETIIASDDHLFQKPNGEWIYTRDLKAGDPILTFHGTSFLVSIEAAGENVVYDLAIGHENHRYFTNGISSHNSGKSLFLQNLAINWALLGFTVIYISLELSEDLVAIRLDAMLTGRGTGECLKNVEETVLRIRNTEKKVKPGPIYIKKLPEGGTTINTVRAYIKEFQIKTGLKPDAILIDYLDLMYPTNTKIDPSDQFIKDKYVSEEMRGYAGEANLLLASASQLNRQSIDAAEYDHSHIAGGISKINTADNVFGIITNYGMKEKGQYKLQFLKTRSSSAVGQTMELAYDPISMRITDAEIVEDVDRQFSKTELRQSHKQPSSQPSHQKSISKSSNGFGNSAAKPAQPQLPAPETESPADDEAAHTSLADRMKRIRQKTGVARP